MGLLHLEIVRERLQREFDLELITTAPSVIYQIDLTNGETVEFYTRADISYPAGVDPRPRVADGGNLPDVLIYRARRYRVTQVEDYLLQGEVYLITATLEDLQASA